MKAGLVELHKDTIAEQVAFQEEIEGAWLQPASSGNGEKTTTTSTADGIF